MHATASFTRLLPLQRQRVRQSRVLPNPYSSKGDAKVPTDKELVRLELTARRKVHADRQRLQPLHTQLVTEMREQLDKERSMLSPIDPLTPDAGMLIASDSSEQEAQSQSTLLENNFISIHHVVSVTLGAIRASIGRKVSPFFRKCVRISHGAGGELSQFFHSNAPREYIRSCLLHRQQKRKFPDGTPFTSNGTA